MGVHGELLLAESLRSFIVENCPDLPVSGGAFYLDHLLPAAASMSLQMGEGENLYRFIDGTRVISQPFTIFYRSENTDDNDAKSAMLGNLNAIGSWMDNLMSGPTPPYLGDWLAVNRLEQVQTANIAEQSEEFITYQAGYALGYETK